MEEVRSYWQVASISHFCNLFGKPFKLPNFEPEELEQAFILDVPASQLSQSALNTNNNSKANSIQNGFSNKDVEDPDPQDADYAPESDQNSQTSSQRHSPPNSPANLNHLGDSTPEPKKPISQANGYQTNFQYPLQISSNQQQNEEQQPQQDLHLLVRLAIALLKPHFTTKMSPTNWDNYLRRIIDSNWVDLENHPSPFRIPFLSPDGLLLTKNLTFNELPLSDKIDLFCALCDYRLWCEDAAEAIKDYSLEELRHESIGKDQQGYEYWYFSGTRLFRENKELSQDLIMRKKRIIELEYKLIELEKARILNDQEEKRKAELERAKQLAAEAREAARQAAKRQHEQEASEAALRMPAKRKKQSTPILPPRTGLRERRSSAASNNNKKSNPNTPEPTRTTRSKLAQQKETPQQQSPQPSTQKTTKSTAKNSKQSSNSLQAHNQEPKKSPEEECRQELEKLVIKREERAEAWLMVCDSLEDWENFATRFEKTKSTNEKYLSAYVNEELLPKIRNIYAKRAAEIKRKEKELLMSLASRRTSSRIINKRAQEEEEERLAQIHEAEMKRKKAEAETRLRAELEREMRARKNRFVVNGVESSTCSEDGDADLNGRYNLRQQQQFNNSDEFDGVIHPDKLSEFYEALELVIDTVRISKHAWPFVDPVPNTVPGYYDLIKEPMDLRKLRTKIEFREYKSLIELEKDFQLLVNNCEKFNGPRNVYTKMVYKLWKSFRKNVRLYLQRDLSMDEYETFIYPPVEAKPKPKSPSPEADHHNSSGMDYDQQSVELDESQSPVDQSESFLNQSPGHEGSQSPVTEPTPPIPEPLSPVGREADSSELEKGEQTLSALHDNNELKPRPPNHVVSPRIDPEQSLTNNYHHQNLPQNPIMAEKHAIKLEQQIPKPESPIPETIIVEQALDPIGEEIIIDSFDAICSDDKNFIWPQDTRPT